MCLAVCHLHHIVQNSSRVLHFGLICLEFLITLYYCLITSHSLYWEIKLLHNLRGTYHDNSCMPEYIYFLFNSLIRKDSFIVDPESSYTMKIHATVVIYSEYEKYMSKNKCTNSILKWNHNWRKCKGWGGDKFNSLITLQHCM